MKTSLPQPKKRNPARQDSAPKFCEKSSATCRHTGDAQTRCIAKWITDHEKTLKQLYAGFKKETKDKKTTFIAFGAFMYNQCKH